MLRLLLFYSTTHGRFALLCSSIARQNANDRVDGIAEMFGNRAKSGFAELVANDNFECVSDARQALGMA